MGFCFLVGGGYSTVRITLQEEVSTVTMYMRNSVDIIGMPIHDN
jgi:hypothetical protein